MLLGIVRDGGDDRVRHVHAERVLAACHRVRSMSRQTRDTTVVSHARMFRTSSASVLDSRSQASCTASSASVSEPSIR